MPDGTSKEVQPENGSQFTLKELQDAVEGFIQVLASKDDRILVVNEEGKLAGMQVNLRATELYVYGEHDPVVGPALACDKAMVA